MENPVADQDRKGKVRGGTILVGLCVAFAVPVGRLAMINTSLAGELRDRVAAQQFGQHAVPSRRGFIFDTSGRMVAGTRQRPSVFADPGLISDPTSVSLRLAPILGTTSDALEATLREHSDGRFCWLKRMIEPADADAIREARLRGIGVRQESQRVFPMGSLMAQTIGIVGHDGKGLEGIELAFDRHLRGRDGTRAAVYNGARRRRPIWLRSDLSRPAVDGGHVVLTLDSVIQGVAEDELRRAVESFEAESGVVIVMSPQSGAVLAMGQYPTFDPNLFEGTSRSVRRNRALCDAVEPGSTFKPYVASGALASGVVHRGEEFDCHQGVYRFGKRTLHDSSPHGVLTFEHVVAYSSNIGMGQIAERMGNAKIFETVRSFGFGSPTGVSFPGEAAGIVRSLKRWTDFSTTSVPMGHEITVTPIQLATAFCSIVNGGRLLKPYLVQALLSPEGEVVRSFDGGRVVRRALSREIADYMRDHVLTEVVKHGGARAAALRDWQMTGKTGTAQVPYRDRRGYAPGEYISSFVGAAPAENPQAVVLVMVHKPNPKLGYYGSTVAAPAVGKIMERVLSYFQTPASLPSGRSG